MQAKHLWALWQALLLPYALTFTDPGYRRFVEWVTGLVLNDEEHTITQSLIGLERVGDWKALETFAEYGAWDGPAIERVTAQVLETAPGRLWYGYHVWGGDDTKVHRTSANVWGTCTYHEYTARCPNRATTVRAHNWVELGALLHNPGQPAWYLPVADRLYFRQSQLPTPSNDASPEVTFHTKPELLVAAVQEQAQNQPGKHLLVADGAFAVRSVVRPLVRPPQRCLRVDILTRLRQDARLYALPPVARRPGQRGPRPDWGQRLSPPRQGGRWPGPWQTGSAFIYGRVRTVRWKEMCCLWWVAGPDIVVKVVVAEVEGYRKRFTLVTTAVVLTGLQMVELFAARFRQEDGFRDRKQRLGWEECRAWTQNPIVRTTQALGVCLTLLRLLQFQLEAEGQTDWWLRPPWNKRKTRPSVLDLERLWRRHRSAIQQLLAQWLGNEENTDGPAEKKVAM
jgi:hypothetical protein